MKNKLTNDNDHSSMLRPATAADLPGANAVVEAAVMAWDLPDRVKRLSLPGYLYQPHDLDHLHLVLAVEADRVVGVAAWEPAAADSAPGRAPALLLHGLYVSPGRQRAGIGSRLLEAALSAAGEGGFAGVLVKAQRSAGSFFLGQGFRLLPVADSGRDYPYRLWRPLSAELPTEGDGRGNGASAR